MRHPVLIVLIGLSLALPACRKFPELEVSEAQFDDDTPYPELVPLEELLNAPEPTIDFELEVEMTERAVIQQGTPQATPPEDATDPIQNRLDALRAKRDDASANRETLNDAMRKRLEEGVQIPDAPPE